MYSKKFLFWCSIFLLHFYKQNIHIFLYSLFCHNNLGEKLNWKSFRLSFYMTLFCMFLHTNIYHYHYIVNVTLWEKSWIEHSSCLSIWCDLSWSECFGMIYNNLISTAHAKTTKKLTFTIKVKLITLLWLKSQTKVKLMEGHSGSTRLSSYLKGE